MSYSQLLAEARRRKVLEVLHVAPGNRANDAALRAVIERKIDVADRALVRADMSYLEVHGLVRIDKLADDGDDIWIATLTDAGSAVARGRQHMGVADRELG
jgi:hypothetical protein